jgi:hypothetical protein
MSGSRRADDRAWLAEQVAKYEKLRPHYRTYADVLAVWRIVAARVRVAYKPW